MMSLNDAVDLVLFAFEKGNSGDLFVNKAPATSIGNLAEALRQMANSKSPVNVIGTRHGEKLYETLCTREEMMKAEDMGEFYRIPADNRDLNYAMYYSKGVQDLNEVLDYHSHNTDQLNIEQVKSLLSTLSFVKKELLGQDIDDYIVL
jgi:UDP-glucose 4-epimerase